MKTNFAAQIGTTSRCRRRASTLVLLWKNQGSVVALRNVANQRPSMREVQPQYEQVTKVKLPAVFDLQGTSLADPIIQNLHKRCHNPEASCKILAGIWITSWPKQKKWVKNCAGTHDYNATMRHDSSNHSTSKHASKSWRSDGSPSCLGGSSHGWVPV